MLMDPIPSPVGISQDAFSFEKNCSCDFIFILCCFKGCQRPNHTSITLTRLPPPDISWLSFRSRLSLYSSSHFWSSVLSFYLSFSPSNRLQEILTGWGARKRKRTGKTGEWGEEEVPGPPAKLSSYYCTSNK